ncbi:MAG TPA: extracellular solute-binding protein [Candidatus Limnocylindria bacterium]|nr:extracellular solute-binding protein [Candidatus Limnocylindria bacterium]
MYRQSRWRPTKIAGVAGIGFVLLLAACGGSGTASAPASEAPESEAPESQAAASEPTGEAVEIEWFVGLGTGENEEQIPTEEAVVEAFNAANPGIHLTLTVVDNTEASTTLATRIAAGDAPDIIGPVGIRGLQSFGDQLLDIGPFIESSGVDLSEIPQALIDVYNVDGVQIGIPMAVYPSFIYYNKTLFDEADLPYPPHEVGEEYDGEPWTWETVRDLAMLLTVDANGNDATSADFDPEAIEQFGLDAQFTENDARAWSTIFGGSGSVVADDGTTAQWPDNWRDGLQYFYDGIWTDHFIPNGTAVQGLADGNTFQSGLVAMDVVHQWYTCCVYPGEGDPAVTDWDIAVLPEGPDGTITSKLHADTIAIMASTEHPEEAFEVLSFLAASPELTEVWGALPAIESQRDAFFASLDERFAPLEIDWNVSTQMLEYPDNPSHEAYMPNFDEADSANKDLGSRLWNTPDLDLPAEIDAHVELLQGIFDDAE